MPLIPINKPVKEPPYVFTNYEKLALEVLPPEQVRASNHDERIIGLMLADEYRDASPEHTLKNVYDALHRADIRMLAAAGVNLTIAERREIVRGIYVDLLLHMKEKCARDEDKAREEAGLKKLPAEVKLFNAKTRVKWFKILDKDPDIDLFHFCCLLSEK